MSISEQVKELRYMADIFEKSGCAVDGIVRAFREAADTIEALSAKLQSENMDRSERYYNGGWIPCEDIKNIPDNEQLVWITIEYKGGGIERIEGIFIDGELCYMSGISVSAIAKAWMPRYVPEPYHP